MMLGDLVVMGVPDQPLRGHIGIVIAIEGKELVGEESQWVEVLVRGRRVWVFAAYLNVIAAGSQG